MSLGNPLRDLPLFAGVEGNELSLESQPFLVEGPPPIPEIEVETETPPDDSTAPAIFDPLQVGFFSDDEVVAWRKEWRGMPEFVQEDLTPWKSIIVHFSTRGDLEVFSAVVDRKLTPNTRSFWFPEAEIGHYANKRYQDEP